MWMGADRRLTDDKKTIVSSEAVKLMDLHTSNSHGTIGYVGQGGKYPNNSYNELGQWLKRCLRDVDCDYATAVEIITQAAQKRISFHKHGFLISGFVDLQPTITFIARGTGVSTVNLNGNGFGDRVEGIQTFGYLHRVIPPELSPAVALHGSGAQYVTRSDQLRLMRLVRRAERIDKYSVDSMGCLARRMPGAIIYGAHELNGYPLTSLTL